MPVIWRRGHFVDGLPLRVEWIGDNRMRLTHQIIYWSHDGERLVVPEGTTTDLASVPRLLRGLTSSAGAGFYETARSGVLHDWLYQTGRTRRARADRIFRQALRSEGVGWIAAWAMWAAVRIGGWRAWSRWEDKRAQEARKRRSGLTSG